VKRKRKKRLTITQATELAGRILGYAATLDKIPREIVDDLKQETAIRIYNRLTPRKRGESKKSHEERRRIAGSQGRWDSIRVTPNVVQSEVRSAVRVYYERREAERLNAWAFDQIRRYCGLLPENPDEMRANIGAKQFRRFEIIGNESLPPHQANGWNWEEVIDPANGVWVDLHGFRRDAHAIIAAAVKEMKLENPYNRVKSDDKKGEQVQPVRKVVNSLANWMTHTRSDDKSSSQPAAAAQPTGNAILDWKAKLAKK
jgi:hypothetical protein